MEALEQPSIHLWGIEIMEPVTSFTDLIVSAICFYAYWALAKRNLKSRAVMYMKWYFIFMGLATLLGGIMGHAFIYAFGFGWKLAGWYTSMIAVALIERSAIEYAQPLIKPRTGKLFLVINLIELITFMVITTITLNFSFVEIHSVYGLMVVVFSFHVFAYKKTRSRGSKLILYAVAAVIPAAVAFNYPISLYKWFNHNDLAHVIMAIASILMLRGALKLEERVRRKKKEKTKESISS